MSFFSLNNDRHIIAKYIIYRNIILHLNDIYIYGVIYFVILIYIYMLRKVIEFSQWPCLRTAYLYLSIFSQLVYSARSSRYINCLKDVLCCTIAYASARVRRRCVYKALDIENVSYSSLAARVLIISPPPPLPYTIIYKNARALDARTTTTTTKTFSQKLKLSTAAGVASYAALQ